MYEEYDSLDFFFFFGPSFLGACGTVRPSTTAARRRAVCAPSHGFVGVRRASGRSSAGPALARDALAPRVVECATNSGPVFSHRMEYGRRSGSPWRISCWESWPCCRVCVFGCDVFYWIKLANLRASKVHQKHTQKVGASHPQATRIKAPAFSHRNQKHTLTHHVWCRDRVRASSTPPSGRSEREERKRRQLTREFELWRPPRPREASRPSIRRPRPGTRPRGPNELERREPRGPAGRARSSFELSNAGRSRRVLVTR